MEVLQDTYKDTKIGRIPKEWEVISISELGKISTSSVDKKSKVEETKVSLINYMDVFGSLNKKITKAIDFMTVTARDTQLIKSQVKKGDVLFTPSSETKKDIGISAVVYEDLPKTLFSYHLLRLSFIKELNLEFKCYLFNSETILKQFELLSQGLTRYTIGLGNFNEIFIPLPPLPEQQKIAAILSTLDKQISTTDKIIEKCKELKKGLMQKLFSEGIGHTEFKDTKIGRIPKDWEVVLMKSVCEIKGGYSFKSNLFKSEGKYQVIRIGNLYGGQLDLNRSPAFIEETNKKYEDFLLKENDLISTMTGTVGKRDFGFIVKIDKEENLFLNQRVCRMRALMINSDFLYFSCSTTQYLDQFFLQATGGTGNQVNIGTTHIGKIKIALPPEIEQQKIAAILSEADAKIEKEQEQKAQLEQLKKGLMQQLLIGKKRVKV